MTLINVQFISKAGGLVSTAPYGQYSNWPLKVLTIENKVEYISYQPLPLLWFYQPDFWSNFLLLPIAFFTALAGQHQVGQPDRQLSALSAGFALDWGLRWEEERGDSDILHRLLTLSPEFWVLTSDYTRRNANTLTTLHITIMIAMDSRNGLFYCQCAFRFSSFFWHCKYLQVTCHWPVTIIGIKNFYRPC